MSSVVDKIVEYNRQGLIPGLQESESDFYKRAAFCQNLKEELKQVEKDLPFNTEEEGSSAILEEAFHLTASLYDMAPSWIPLFFSNYQLAPWHGGCAWIFQINEQTPLSAFLQLRSQFKHQQRYLGLYKRNELLAHEMAHVGRMMFEEPQFEELLAYRSSSSLFRRWFGPIFQSSGEALLFILVLGIMIMADLALMTFPSESTYSLTLWIKLIPLFLLSAALVRLGLRHWYFDQCTKRLAAVYGNAATARHVLYRLNDETVRLFSKLSPDQIAGWMREQCHHSFYWQFLLICYPVE